MKSSLILLGKHGCSFHTGFSRTLCMICERWCLVLQCSASYNWLLILDSLLQLQEQDKDLLDIGEQTRQNYPHFINEETES